MDGDFWDTLHFAVFIFSFGKYCIVKIISHTYRNVSFLFQ